MHRDGSGLHLLRRLEEACLQITDGRSFDEWHPQGHSFLQFVDTMATESEQLASLLRSKSLLSPSHGRPVDQGAQLLQALQEQIRHRKGLDVRTDTLRKLPTIVCLCCAVAILSSLLCPKSPRCVNQFSFALHRPLPQTESFIQACLNNQHGKSRAGNPARSQHDATVIMACLRFQYGIACVDQKTLQAYVECANQQPPRSDASATSNAASVATSCAAQLVPLFATTDSAHADASLDLLRRLSTLDHNGGYDDDEQGTDIDRADASKARPTTGTSGVDIGILASNVAGAEAPLIPVNDRFRVAMTQSGGDAAATVGGAVVEVTHHQFYHHPTIRRQQFTGNAETALHRRLRQAMARGSADAVASILTAAAVDNQSLLAKQCAARGDESLQDALLGGVTQFTLAQISASRGTLSTTIGYTSGPYRDYFEEARIPTASGAGAEEWDDVPLFEYSPRAEIAAGVFLHLLCLLPPVLRVACSEMIVDTLQLVCDDVCGSQLNSSDADEHSAFAEHVLLRAALHCPLAMCGMFRALDSPTATAHPVVILQRLGVCFERDAWKRIDLGRAFQAIAQWSTRRPPTVAIGLQSPGGATVMVPSVQGHSDITSEDTTRAPPEFDTSKESKESAQRNEDGNGDDSKDENDRTMMESGSANGNEGVEDGTNDGSDMQGATEDEAIATATSMTPQWRHIQQLREERYLGSEGTHIHVMVQRLLPVASKLYKDSAHFMLELIQNSNDCRYETGVSPTLYMQFTKEEVAVHCNEVGFCPQNVSDICDITRSEKLGMEGKVSHPATAISPGLDNVSLSLLLVVLLDIS